MGRPKSHSRAGPIAAVAVMVLAIGVAVFAWIGREEHPGRSEAPSTATPSPSATPQRVAPGAVKPEFFARTSIFNAPLPTDAALDPRSQELVGTLRRLADEQQSQRRGPTIATTSYSTPVYTVPRNAPTVSVKLDTFTPSPLQAAFSRVPLPRDAQPAAGRDGQLTVHQPSTDTLWEFWRLRREGDGWHATWGGVMRHVSQSPGWYTPKAYPGAKAYWGAASSKLPLVGGMITVNELRRGRIDHALALGLPEIRTNLVAAPAQRTDGKIDERDAIPMGARFRLDPRLDLESLNLPSTTLAIARAAQRYGFIVRDTSGGVTLYGEDPRPSGTSPYAEILNRGGQDVYPDNQYRLFTRFPWDRLQLLRMRLSEPAR